jgi:hypothetical protein
MTVPTSGLTSLLVATDRCVLEVGGERFAMEPMDCLKAPGSLRGKIAGERRGSAYLIEITAIR